MTISTWAYMDPQHRNGIYRVELERGGKVAKVFFQCLPVGSSPRIRCDVPTLAGGRRSAKEMQRLLDGYAHLRGWLRACRLCGCTDDDCRGCIERTGQPCSWELSGVCSACLKGHA